MSSKQEAGRSAISVASGEVMLAFSLWRFSLYRAIIHTKLAHRNTSLGLLWEPLLLLIVSFFISLVWSKIFGVKDFKVFFQYVLIGFAIWGFISSVVNRGVNIIRGYANTIINSRDPILSYILSDIFCEVTSYLLKFPLILLVILVMGDLSFKGVLIHIYGLFLISISGVGFALVFGTFAAFYGDVKELISAFMRLAFLVTPVIWTIDRLGEYQSYIYLNPFFSYLQICRQSLLEGTADSLSLIIASVLTLLILVSGLIVLGSNTLSLKQKVFEL